MLKQLAHYFSIYMRRIREQEAHTIHKLARAFAKIEQVEHKLEHYDQEMEQLEQRTRGLEELLATWDARIEEQKGVYKAAVEECRKEEALIEEMGAKLEELRAAVNIDQHSQANSPQYEMALEAIESLSKADFNELKSFRFGLELRNGLGCFVRLWNLFLVERD
jgi:chromosome segregation ATPase